MRAPSRRSWTRCGWPASPTCPSRPIQTAAAVAAANRERRTERNMNALRVPIAVFISAVLTTSMFWVLWDLINRQFDTTQFQEGQRIEFSRMRKDTEVQTKRDQKIERDRPPPTPEAP